jgi:ferredoxin-NADP reductase
MDNNQDYHWRIEKITEEAPQVRSHFLSCKEDRPPFLAGQYLTIKLPGLSPEEGKAYSIASTPDETYLRITVKTIGMFSATINQLKIGDEITTSAPYGFFYPEPADSTPLVFIVGGIGITPCFSIIKDLLSKGDTRPLHLFYSNQTEVDIIFRSELETLASHHPTFSINHFITREHPTTVNYHSGRLNAEKISELTNHLLLPEFFICGSIGFTRDLWSALKQSGIKPERLYTEGFF